MMFICISQNGHAANPTETKRYATICDKEEEALSAQYRDSREQTHRLLGIQQPQRSSPIARGENVGSLKPRKPHTKLKDFNFDKNIHAGIIDVKFVEGSDIALENGVLVSGNKKFNLDQVNDTIAKHGMSVRPLFSRPPEELKADKACGEMRSGEEMPDLSLWFEIEIDDARERAGNYGPLNATMRRLNALAEIEVLQTRSPLSPPPRSDIPPVTPNFIPQQVYLRSAATAVTGIDADYGYGLGASGRGAGVKMIMVGGGWMTTHEEFLPPFAKDIQPDGLFLTDVDHDTGAMGIIVADDQNGVGMRGIAPSASYSYISHHLTDKSSRRPAEAINLARAAPFNLGPGDVLIVETGVCIYKDDPEFPSVLVGTSSGYLPNFKCVFQEYNASVFDAIHTATSMGVTVISPAHNSDLDHDQPFFNGRYTVGSPNFVDSGAIIVGSKRLDGARLGDSNFGSRIDVSGLGEALFTAGANCPNSFSCVNQSHFPAIYDPNNVYNPNYGGTSGAAPIVAGAAIVLQSLQKARGGKPIPPKVLRQIFRDIGTQQLGDVSKRVGRTPNLRAIWERMNADDDGDSMLNIDELIVGRNPKLDERRALLLLLEDN